MRCDSCPNRHDCMSECDFAYEEEETDEDYLEGCLMDRDRCDD
jgi:hypothetical protein